MRVETGDLKLDGTDLSTDVESEGIFVERCTEYSIQLVFTGTPVGEFKLQGSLDGGTPSNWTDITGSEESVTEAGDILWNAQGVGYRWVRLVYTSTSGTGTLTVYRSLCKGAE